jgi:hypothetical protein
MAQETELGKWIREKFRSQAKFADKIGAHPTLISRWMGGAGISEDYEKVIRGLGFKGLLPAQEVEDAAAGGPAVYVTREEFAEEKGALRAEIRLLRESLEKAFELIRDLKIELTEGSRPRGH